MCMRDLLDQTRKGDAIQLRCDNSGTESGTGANAINLRISSISHCCCTIYIRFAKTQPLARMVVLKSPTHWRPRLASIASSLQHIKDNPLILVGNETGTQLVFWGVRGKLPGMSRKARVAPGGRVYHVLNRSAGRTQLFRTDHDFLAFQRIMLEAWIATPCGCSPGA